MNADQYTQKSMEAIQAAQRLAQEEGHQQIEQVHLLLALVEAERGLVPQLLTAMGLTLPSLEAALRKELSKLPRVSGSEIGRAHV